MTFHGAIRWAAKEASKKVLAAASKVIGYCTQPLWSDVECLFVLSTGRTGTKTLARLLNLSSKIGAFHEPRPQLLKERKTARHEVHSRKRKYERIFVVSKGQALFRAHRRGKIYVETSARLTFFAPVIASLLPNAKFLYIHRDPAQVVRSGMRRGWYVDHPADHARVEPVEGEAFYEEWESLDQFSKICWYWDVYNKFALQFRESVNSERILTINAEDLFHGTAVPDIFKLLEVTTPPAEQVERILGRKLNAQKSGYFPKSENWTPEMYQALQDIAGETMGHLGYSFPEEGVSTADPKR